MLDFSDIDTPSRKNNLITKILTRLPHRDNAKIQSQYQKKLSTLSPEKLTELAEKPSDKILLYLKAIEN